MNKAYIYFNDVNNNSFSEEGCYVLLFNNYIIASHFCSNSNFANHDLTVWELKILEKYNIDEVISNGEVVWKRRDEKVNKKTQKQFVNANNEYETKYCR